MWPHSSLLVLLISLLLLVQARGQEFVLTQADFDDGTVIISTPGTYRLTEDIVFQPNFPSNVDVNNLESILEEPELFLFPTEGQRKGTRFMACYRHST